MFFPSHSFPPLGSACSAVIIKKILSVTPFDDNRIPRDYVFLLSQSVSNLFSSVFHFEPLLFILKKRHQIRYNQTML
jgi:hypothetical protein